METQESGDPHQWLVPTEQEKIESFGHPVVGLARPDSSFSRFIGLDYVDHKPVILDVVYKQSEERVIQVRNIISSVPGYRDIVSSSLIEFLLNNKHFVRSDDHTKKDELDRAADAHNRLKRYDPTEKSLRIDGHEYRSEMFELDGYVASCGNISKERSIVVIGRNDLLSQSTIATLKT